MSDYILQLCQQPEENRRDTIQNKHLVAVIDKLGLSQSNIIKSCPSLVVIIVTLSSGGG